MYITKITLNPYRAESRAFLSNPQRVHAGIMKCFSEDALKATAVEGRPLWRLEEVPGKDPYILLTSPLQPDATHLMERYGRINDPYSVQTHPLEQAIESIQVGDNLRFKVKLNPVVDRKGKHVPHITPFFLLTFLQKKLASHGCTVSDRSAQVTSVAEVSFRHNMQSKERITLATATFEGTLKVADALQVRTALRQGVGRGKAYGLGLLSVSRNNGY